MSVVELSSVLDRDLRIENAKLYSVSGCLRFGDLISFLYEELGISQSYYCHTSLSGFHVLRRMGDLDGYSYVMFSDRVSMLSHLGRNNLIIEVDESLDEGFFVSMRMNERDDVSYVYNFHTSDEPG